MSRESLRDAYSDPGHNNLRRELCGALIGQVVDAARWFDGDVRDAVISRLTTPASDDPAARRFLGVSAVMHMAAELAVGCGLVLSHRLTYACSALVRQLIEAEYLLFLFAENPDEADRWAGSTSSQIVKKFSPSAMRKRSHGRFAASEYSSHCNRGGHPSPEGILVISGWKYVTPPDISADAAVLHDLAQHLQRVWETMHVLMTRHYSPYAHGHVGEWEAMRLRLEAWHAVDPIARLRSDDPLARSNPGGASGTVPDAQ